QRLGRVLAEEREHDGAGNQRQRQGDEGRQHAEQRRTLRPLDQLDAHQATSFMFATWPGSAPPIRRPIFSKVASAIGSGFDSSPLCMTAIASEISNSAARSWLRTSTAEPLRASSISAWRIRAAAPASTPQVG